MTEPQPSVADPTQRDPTEPTTDDRPVEPGRIPVWRLVWAAMALAFLGYVAVGSVEARIWRFNRLYYEDRRILEVWQYAVAHLPELPADSVVTALFVASLVILVAGAVLGFWYLLAEAGLRAADRGSPARTTDAEHA